MKKVLLFTLILLSFHSESIAQNHIDFDKQVKAIEKQYNNMLLDCRNTDLFPQSMLPNNSMFKRKADWWCSGFFSGCLWYIYELTHQEKWKAAAQKWTMPLKDQQYNKTTHDLGFMLYCSFGNGYRLTHNKEYKSILINGATTLSNRFNPKVGVIKSWDTFKHFNYPVIIDNMMNLEYLFWAAKITGNKNFYDICISHANKTMLNHFRHDNSSYHVVCYDSVGNVVAKKTSQGFADSSAWARGQTWGLYGYTVMYRETKDKKYLEQAIKIANYYINSPNLPADLIPYWDFNSPNIPNDVRDASAAAICASGLLELSKYVDKKMANKYFVFAEQVLKNLSSSSYFAGEQDNYFLLKHSTGNKPANSEIDTPIIYADYYYLEALIRYRELLKVDTQFHKFN
jgi:rhamnogalacturonyl hydrolase YesR